MDDIRGRPEPPAVRHSGALRGRRGPPPERDSATSPTTAWGHFGIIHWSPLGRGSGTSLAMACVYSGTSLAAAVASFGTVRCHRLYAIHERRRPPLGRHSATSLAIEKNKIDNERHGKRKRCVPRKSAKHAVRTRIVMAPVHLENRVVPQIQASSTIGNSCTFYPGAAGLVLRLNVVNPQHWVMMTALRCHQY